MSKIVFSAQLTPGMDGRASFGGNLKYDFFGDLVSIPHARLFPWKDNEIVERADVRSYRTMSRAGLLLSRTLRAFGEELSRLISAAPERVGIYCAVDSGPFDYDSVNQAAGADFESTAEVLLAQTPPKQSFKNGQGFVGAQIAIDLGIRGPLYTYGHSRFGAVHALCQAEFDLNSFTVDRALICSAFSLDDPLQSARTLLAAGRQRPLSEGAASLVLERGPSRSDWERIFANLAKSEDDAFYGISDPLIKIITESHQPHEN